MEPLNLFRRKYFSGSRFKLINKRFGLIFSLLLSLLVVSTAYADATFGSYDGPQWISPGYRFTVYATLTEPHKYVGLTNSVNSVTYPCVECTRGSATWTCTIASSYNNSTVAWSIAAYPNARCIGTSVQGPTGTFTTGPTVLALSRFIAENAKESFFSNSSLLIIASAAVFILLALGWRYKRGKHVAGSRNH